MEHLEDMELERKRLGETISKLCLLAIFSQYSYTRPFSSDNCVFVANIKHAWARFGHQLVDVNDSIICKSAALLPKMSRLSLPQPQL